MKPSTTLLLFISLLRGVHSQPVGDPTARDVDVASGEQTTSEQPVPQTIPEPEPRSEESKSEESKPEESREESKEDEPKKDEPKTEDKPEPKLEDPKDQKPALNPKYFQEPDDGILAHYDSRFFKAQVTGDAHVATLHHLIRSYLTTMRMIGVETWLAHGTLLGWWWNGRVLPWDGDLDVQMATSSLEVLARGYNCTTHVYRYRQGEGEDGEPITGNYLLDINPHYGDIYGDGMNVIDARWIDMQNGMYVDITGLAERNPKDRPGRWGCRNHDYPMEEFFPLEETMFEGVTSFVPKEFKKVLVSEYGEKSMNVTDWEGWRWYENEEVWRRPTEEEKKADEEKKKAEEEAKKAEEEKKKAEEEAAKTPEQKDKEAEERKKKDEEERQKKEEEERKKKEEEEEKQEEEKKLEEEKKREEEAKKESS